MPRGMSYPASLAAEARNLAEGGWTVHQIRGLFARRGLEHVPHRVTIESWVDPEFAQRHRDEQRERLARQAAAGANFRPSGTSLVYQQAFARFLVCEVGLTRRAASLLLARFYGPRWTEHTVKVAVAGDRQEATA